jgi:enoyl-[acyl-carrier protein] reductase II
LALGAEGVWIGTRFIATPEARAVPGFKEGILASREDGTVVSRAFSGKTMRVLRNDTTDRYEADPSLLKKFPEQLKVSSREGTFHLGGDEETPGVDPRREGYPAGQVVGAITTLEPAGDIVRSMVTQAERIIAGLSPR